MPTSNYAYSVRDRGGKLLTGTMDGPSKTAVVTKLKAMGLIPVKVEPKSAGMQAELHIPGFGPKVTLKDLAIFSRQFATMVNSGLSLIRALNILTEQTESKELARILSEVRTDVETGSSLSASMAKHPHTFPPLMVNMTRAGELGGFLDTVMLQVADNFENEVKLRSKIKSAMTYPTVVFVMAILMCTAMLLFIVPIFAKMFASLGGQLPAPTRLLIALSHIVKFGGPIFIVAAVVFLIWWRKHKIDSWVRNLVDPLKLRLPVFGQLFQKIALSRFTRNLGAMMRAGVPILHALDIVSETTGSVVVGRAVRDVQDSVRRGEALARPLESHAVFPPMVVQMMAVGEDTGALDTMLLKISQFYDAEVEATSQALTSLIEPLMIAFLGIVVGSMIVALYLPIFDIYNLVK